MELEKKNYKGKKNKNGGKERRKFHNGIQLITWLPYHSFMPDTLEKAPIFAIRDLPKSLYAEAIFEV